MKKFVSLLCTALLLFSATFVPTIASASTINTELASNPAATIAEIEKIGLPMSDEMAGEMRGEQFVFFQAGRNLFAAIGAYFTLEEIYRRFSWSCSTYVTSTTANSTVVVCN